MVQTPYYFNRTVLENVRYAKPGASDEEVHEACRRACIHDTIMERGDGYETNVGENGFV